VFGVFGLAIGTSVGASCPFSRLTHSDLMVSACVWRPAAATGKHANKRMTRPRLDVAFTHKINALRGGSCRRLLVPCETRSSLLRAEDIALHALQNQTSPSISKSRLCLCHRHCHCRQPTLKCQPRHACLPSACERFWWSWPKEQRAGLQGRR
jgi:hypothetical protein